VVVTGGAGFLGSRVVRDLVAAGSTVRVVDNGYRGGFDRLEDVKHDVEIRRGDVRDSEFLRAALRGADAVWHLAAVNGTRRFYSDPGLVLEVGVQGMLSLLESCRAQDVGSLVLFSSSEVYGSPQVVPTAETAPLMVSDPANPRFSYALSKIASEVMAMHMGTFERLLIVRPHNVYGPNMGMDHVIPELTMRALSLAKEAVAEGSESVRLPIQGTGLETRAFMFVDDFSEACMKLWQKAECAGVFNVGFSTEVSILALVEEIARKLCLRVEVIPGAVKGAAGGPTRRCPDTSRLSSLGFEPRVSLACGIDRTVEWYEQAFRDAGGWMRPSRWHVRKFD
jgi:nucleoside-diphosphate-sugar epimerase